MTRPVIVCPSGPDRTRSISDSRWGSKPTGMSANFLERRRRYIHEYRTVGDLFEAERYGWLTLSTLWVGLGPKAALGQNPSRKFDFTGTLVTPPKQELSPMTATIPNSDLVATDPRDAFGLWLADLSADSASRAIVSIDDAPVASAVVADTLSRMLAE